MSYIIFILVNIIFSAERYVSLSKVIPMYQNLLQFYQKEARTENLVTELCQELCDQIKEKFEFLSSSKECHLATLFDPRFKKYVCKGDLQSTRTKFWAKEEALSKMENNESSVENPIPRENTENNLAKVINHLF